MFEDRFGREDIGGFGDGVEFGYMTDDDIAAMSAVAEFESTDPDDKDFVPQEEVTSRVTRKRDREDAWWRSATSRRQLMDDVSARFRGPTADIDCLESMFHELGVALERYGDGLRGACPDDDHFSNEKKKPFRVSAQGWCYCFACAQSQGADYKGYDAVTYFKRQNEGRLNAKEAYQRLAEIAGIDVRSYTPDSMAAERVRAASRFADAEGKYTWSDVKKINEIRSKPIEERRDYMRRSAIVEIRKAAQDFYHKCLVDPERTLVDPVRRRFEQAEADLAAFADRKAEIENSLGVVGARLRENPTHLASAISALDQSLAHGAMTSAEHETRTRGMYQAAGKQAEADELALEAGHAALSEAESAINYHRRVAASAGRALTEAKSAAASAREMASVLVSMGIASVKEDGTLIVPDNIGYAPPIRNAAVHYLMAGPDDGNVRFSPSDIRCAGIGQKSSKKQIERGMTEDRLYDRITFAMESAYSGEVVGFAGIRPQETVDKVRYMVTGPATFPDGSIDEDVQVAFDWKSDIYNVLAAAPHAVESGVLYRANNPLDVEALRAIGISNVCSPARGGTERDGGLGVQFHYASHDRAIAEIVDAISIDGAIEVVALSHAEVLEMLSPSAERQQLTPSQDMEQVRMQAGGPRTYETTRSAAKGI